MNAPIAEGGRDTPIAVVTRLATRVARGDAPFGVIGDALAELATTLDASRVIVAVDDRVLGRQVFTSARAPLGAEPIGLFGRPGAWTDPDGRLDDDEAELLAATVGIALGTLAVSGPLPASPIATTEPALPAVIGAAARARIYGWSFTLALVRFEDHDASSGRIAALQSVLRPGDLAVPAGRGALAALFPAARDDEAAAILGTAVRSAGLPRCTFGLARCPGDASDAVGLVRLAARRLDEAVAARYPSRHME